MSPEKKKKSGIKNGKRKKITHLYSRHFIQRDYTGILKFPKIGELDVFNG